MSDDERRLREAFQTQRAEERAHAPGFQGVLEGRPASRHWTSAMPAVGLVLAAGVVALTVAIGRSEARRAELELARQVMSWRSPTEFLLPAPVPGLVLSVPRIDEAPAGSPLKALDKGGALGPPNTARSPRS